MLQLCSSLLCYSGALYSDVTVVPFIIITVVVTVLVMRVVSHVNLILDVDGVLLCHNVCQGQTRTFNQTNVELRTHLNGL